jgi:YbbR domain-containing protein
MPGYAQRGFFHRVFIHNFWLKLVSLLLAIGLWKYQSRDPVAEVEMRVPIEFQNLPDNLEIDSTNSTEVQIRIRGPERVIHRLQAADVHAEINLATVRPGERTFDLSSPQIHVPQDLEVVQIIPGQFHLSFDERATRRIEVQPRVTGNFASGLQVAQLIADPPNVTITGPRRRVEAMEAATTDPVDATGVVTRATFVTHAYVTDPLILVAHPTSIRVTVIMERSGNEKK